jgi:hypothetical protein
MPGLLIAVEGTIEGGVELRFIELKEYTFFILDIS